MHQIIHKAAFFWNSIKNRQQLTSCGNVDYKQNHVKTTDWNEVTCKHCLRAKDYTPASTVNLL